jgi:hypothetical protein
VAQRVALRACLRCPRRKWFRFFEFAFETELLIRLNSMVLRRCFVAVLEETSYGNEGYEGRKESTGASCEMLEMREATENIRRSANGLQI